MHTDKFTVSQQVLHTVCLLYFRRETPSRFDSYFWVITDDFHAQLDGRVGNQSTDFTEADNAQGTAWQFDSGKSFLAFLGLGTLFLL